MSLLRCERLRKRYKSRAVVQDVSLEVSSGEVVGLLGPNGAGKTTCFYMIVGLIAADSGRIHLDGRELTHLPIHARARLGISYLPQENSVFRKLSVEENVQAVLELQGLARGEIEPRLQELLKDLNIAHLRKHAALPEAAPALAEFLRPRPVVAHADESLRAVVYRMAATGHSRLLVVERGDPQRVTGVLTLSHLLKARARHLEEERRLDGAVPLPFRPTPIASEQRS